MNRLLLLLVPLVLLVSCESSVEVGAEPPTKPAPWVTKGDIIVGSHPVCHLQTRDPQGFSETYGDMCIWANGPNEGEWLDGTRTLRTVRTLGGVVYTVRTDFDPEGNNPKVGDTLPPSD